MRHRGNMTAQERQERSRLAQLVHRESFLQGSLVDSKIKCGKSNCWCSGAKKGHSACYLSIRVGNKRKMIYVPKEYEKKVRGWIKNYQDIAKHMAAISQCCLIRLKDKSVF